VCVEAYFYVVAKHKQTKKKTEKMSEKRRNIFERKTNEREKLDSCEIKRHT
jgi:hypothetical protein